MRSSRQGLGLGLAVFIAPLVAQAHIHLDSPVVRANSNLKTGPCGGVAAETPQVLDGWTAGATVTVKWTETINHPGHYRIALSRTGEAAFVDPDGLEDMTTDGIDLLDGIEDQSGSNTPYEVEVTLPNEPCESCILQLIQVMTDKPSAPFYYQCADIVIQPADGGGSGGADAGTGGDGAVGGSTLETGGSEAGGTGATGAAPAGGAGDCLVGAGGTDPRGCVTGGAPSVIGGAPSTGGVSSAGGATTAAGGSVAVGGGPAGVPTGGDDSSAEGCSCSTGPVPVGIPWASLLFLLPILRPRKRS